MKAKWIRWLKSAIALIAISGISTKVLSENSKDFFEEVEENPTSEAPKLRESLIRILQNRLNISEINARTYVDSISTKEASGILSALSSENLSRMSGHDVWN